MTLRTADFRCLLNPEHVMLDQIVELDEGETLSSLKMTCPHCEAADMEYFLPPGTRIAMQGDENVPREMLASARDGIVRMRGGDGVKPYDGPATRSGVKGWMQENHLEAMAPDEARRGNATINTPPPKLSQTKEFQEQIAADVARNIEIVKAGGDRLAEAKGAIDKPNAYDVNSFQQQAGSDAVATPEVSSTDVAQELTATE